MGLLPDQFYTMGYGQAIAYIIARQEVAHEDWVSMMKGVRILATEIYNQDRKRRIKPEQYMSLPGEESPSVKRAKSRQDMTPEEKREALRQFAAGLAYTNTTT